MVALVLLPGLDGTGLLLADFAASFAHEVNVVVASYPRDIPLDYAELELIARSFLPVNEPYFLLAESFSGPIAIAIAASVPPGLCGLILCCSFARNPQPLLAFGRPVIGILPMAAIPVAVLSFFVLGRSSSRTLRDGLAATIAAVAPEVLRMRAKAALSVDVAALISRIKVPLLYLRATEDRVVPKSSFDLIISLAPATQLVEFIAPHFLLQVAPSLAASTVTTFMGSHCGGLQADTG